MCHLRDARVRTLLPHKCYVAPRSVPPVKEHLTNHRQEKVHSGLKRRWGSATELVHKMMTDDMGHF